jgi:ferredoxin
MADGKIEGRIGGKTCLICNCEGTMPLDTAALAKALARVGGTGAPPDIHTQLCRAQLDSFKSAMAGDGPVLVGCTQEAPLFSETVDEMFPGEEGGEEGGASVSFTNIRERAGWSAEAGGATPKIAALLAEAALDIPATPSVSMTTEGLCLVYGRDETAIEAARQLSGRLDVTVVLKDPGEIAPPRVMDVPVFRGRVAAVGGHLGAFELVVDDYAPAIVSSRGFLAFEAGRDGAASRCDLILDLTGEAPLVPAPEKRDGYFNPDPGNPAAVQRSLFDLADMVGEYEKPRYVAYDAALCAHSRSQLTGCTRCLDVCPASAIRPDGDIVAIDPYLCGGCGACSSVCPTGAARYDMPPAATVLERLRTLLAAYHDAGGTAPVLLVHDTRHGEDLIAAAARFGRGLPAAVLPFAVNETTQIGFDFLAAGFAYGATRILLLVGPDKRDELAGLAGQIGLAEAVMDGLGYEGGRAEVLVESDPEALEATLYGLTERSAAAPSRFLPLGEKRTVTRLALDHLHSQAPNPVDHLPLPPGAPFGTLDIDAEGCTLCLACVGACPTGALRDNPDRPQLGFVEDACVQCGLCRVTCPESVIRLAPRISFTPEARQTVVVKEEEPFECIRCGAPFGTRASVERIYDQLASKHSMFKDPKTMERIKMCNDCRVIDQFADPEAPFAGAPRPMVRTTDDDLREREAEIEAARAKLKAERAAGGTDEAADS